MAIFCIQIDFYNYDLLNWWDNNVAVIVETSLLSQCVGGLKKAAWWKLQSLSVTQISYSDNSREVLNMIQLPFGANFWWHKILTNGVISDFDKEHFDKCCCLPDKHTIIQFLLSMHAHIAVITTPCHIVHLQITSDTV